MGSRRSGQLQSIAAWQWESWDRRLKARKPYWDWAHSGG